MGESKTNPYLYRLTERRLATLGGFPLSVVKDMIGSQSTKAIHALAKFAPKVETLGVWSDGRKLRIIETYPTACRARSNGVAEFNISALQGRHGDIIDAGFAR